MGTHLKELSDESFLMNTNMTGFRCFSELFFIFFSWTKLASAWKGLNICRCMRPCEMVNHWFTNNYTAKIFGQKTDTKRLTNVRTANGYKSAHATVCALKHWSTVCCPMFGFLPVIIASILQKCYFLIFIQFSYPIFQYIGQLFVHKRPQTFDQNISQPFDTSNFLLCTAYLFAFLQNVSEVWLCPCRMVVDATKGSSCRVKSRSPKVRPKVKLSCAIFIIIIIVIGSLIFVIFFLLNFLHRFLITHTIVVSIVVPIVVAIVVAIVVTIVVPIVVLIVVDTCRR